MLDTFSIRNLHVRIREVASSLLANAFNQCWVAALNEGHTFFLMVHDDIVPLQPRWPAILFEEMAEHRASVLSAVSPIKTRHGLTSTAVETDDPWNPRRLSMAEVFERPETWTEPGLLINTGLMLVDMREAWTRYAYFTIHDRIVERDGLLRAEVQPEDWNFSRMAHAAGATVYATRKVRINHVGRHAFSNGEVWGDLETDTENTK